MSTATPPPASTTPPTPLPRLWKFLLQLAAVAVCLLFAGALLSRWLAVERAAGGRSVCAANLKGFVQAMNVYGNDNADAYPIVNSGNVVANLWILVARGDVSPVSFLCDKDPFVERSSAKGIMTYSALLSPRHLSYSVAYPWNSDGTASPLWKATIDASLPIMSDMAPLQGTGSPATNVTANPLTKSANSGNHQRNGQNVAFGDNHVEFVRLPNCGQSNDNIFTASSDPSTGPREFGGIPAGVSSPHLTVTEAPFDIVMLPVRNETTGAY